MVWLRTMLASFERCLLPQAHRTLFALCSTLQSWNDVRRCGISAANVVMLVGIRTTRACLLIGLPCCMRLSLASRDAILSYFYNTKPRGPSLSACYNSYSFLRDCVSPRPHRAKCTPSWYAVVLFAQCPRLLTSNCWPAQLWVRGKHC